MPKWGVILFLSIWLLLPQPAWALQYSYEMYPADNAVISSSMIPKLQLVVQPDENISLSQYKIWLDGVEYPPQYDQKNGIVWVKLTKTLQPGFHTVQFQYAFSGYVEHTLTSQFEVKEALDPYQGINKKFYQQQSDLAIRQLNVIRHNMGLPLLQENQALMTAAQAHANYIVDKISPGNITEEVHHETPGISGYTGQSSTERASFFNYYGSTSEGIDPGGASVPELGVIRLLDSPYHRLSMIDVNYQQIGAGVSGNRLQNLVINYGTSQKMADDRIMVYPYRNQKGVPLAWQAYEVPFPLRFFSVNEGTVVGYPISVHVSSQDVERLHTVKARLTDSNGHEIDCYQVDSDIEDHSKNHLFLIPKQPLQPGVTYFADVSVEKWYNNGQVKAERIQWHFTTASKLKARLASIELGTNGSELLQIQTNLGDWPDLQFKLYQNSEPVQSMANQEYQTYLNKSLSEGIYDLVISSPKLSQEERVRLQIWQDNYGYKHLKILP